MRLERSVVHRLFDLETDGFLIGRRGNGFVNVGRHGDELAAPLLSGQERLGRRKINVAGEVHFRLLGSDL